VKSLRLLEKIPIDLKIPVLRRLRTTLAFWSVILTAMAGLLTAVAILQYRWTTEAANAEEVRIGAQLDSLMMKWHRDLYGEFSAICVAMQVGPDSGARDTWNDYLERYVEWNYALPHELLPNVYRNPDLVNEIYIWETNLQPHPQLLLLNVDRKKIQPTSVPPELGPLLDRLEKNSGTLSMALSAWQFPGRPSGLQVQSNGAAEAGPSVSNTTTGWQFDENIPALVHPILHHEGGKVLNSQSPVDWIVITLDLSVLKKRILPELSTRYFGGLDGLDYRVGVIATGSKARTIYSSDAGFGIQDFPSADSLMSIFGPTPEAQGTNSRPLTITPPGLRGMEWHSFLGPLWFPVFEYASQPDPWVLLLQRRADPLQVVISRVRRKNLTLSALVLLLLVASMAVLTVSGLSAQKFAKLQMNFVASISHELRTPLTVIYSAGENIKDGVVTERPGLQRYGGLIMTQTRILINDVDRILQFTSARSGRDRYNFRPLQVADILQRVRDDTVGNILEESVVIEESIEPGLPRVSGDFMAVCSCLENLISNAAKYGGADRRVHIRASLQNKENHQQAVLISVEDQGMGIKASELKQVFEPFFRSPAAIEAQIHGTGLGLSLAKHLAEAMGGTLSVSSELGVGSIFTLSLMVAQPTVDDNV